VKTIVFSHASAKDADGLPTDVREAVAAALDLFAISGRGDVKKLAGQSNMFRLRVGRYQVIFTQAATTIDILYVGKRERTTYR
jgi:mRNA interferase RelE/StbE